MSEMVRLITAMSEKGLIFAHRDMCGISFQRISDYGYVEFKDWDEVAKFVDNK